MNNVATSFDEIYGVNGSIMEDLRTTNKPDNIYYFVLYNYLYLATAEFSQYCYKDLLDISPFQQTIDTFETDGLTFDFELSETPPTDCIFYVSVDGEKLEDDQFTYDELTNTITTTVSGDYVYIGAYVIGQFNVDLNQREISILASAMNTFFIMSNVDTSRNLDQVMYEGVRMFSQAQHNKATLDIEKFRKSDSFRAMVYYSYGRDGVGKWNIAKKAGV